MNILNLSLGQDTGGQQMRLARAWKRYFPDDTYVSVTSTHTFYEIQNQMTKAQVANEWWPAADVVHINNDIGALSRFPRNSLEPKPLVVHHHGTMYRTRPEYHLEQMRRYHAIGICSTVDLWAIAPEETHWMPQAYEPEELSDYREAAEARRPAGGDPIRIAHAPTNRIIKSTKALSEAVARLRWLGAKVELDIIEKVDNKECLRRKAEADIFVDQLLLGYGCNAIEAWGMGIPVVAGVQREKCRPLIRMDIPEDTQERMWEQWGMYPFASATEENLINILGKMLDPAYRQTWADIGMQHFMQHHHAHKVVHRLRALYTEAINRGPWTAPMGRGYVPDA